jgi:hypothetical protein
MAKSRKKDDQREGRKEDKTYPPQKEPRYKPLRRTNLVPVKITVKEDQIVFEPQELVLVAANRDEAFWQCDRGKLEVRFSPRDTPFAASLYEAPKNGGCLSGLPDSQAAGRSVQYTILVTTEDGRFVTTERQPREQWPRVTVKRRA